MHATLLSTLLVAWVGTAAGHGSLLFPPPRQGVEKVLPEFAGGKFPHGHYNCQCTNGTELCNSAQSCLWFNQGCTIGCKCSGNGTASRMANYNSCGTAMKPSNNDPHTRSINKLAAAGTSEDVYKFMPWRAPGTAMLMDPCGVAGGSPYKQKNGGEYINTTFGKQGDFGSKVLQPLPNGVVWQAGTVVQTSIFIKANHAGGWQFRLCRVGTELSEDCFQQTPIPFEGTEQILRFGDGHEEVINATLLSEGTMPKNSTWIMNPLPECCPADGACERQGLLCGSSTSKACYNHQCGVNAGLGPSEPAFPWPTTSVKPTNLPTNVAIIDRLRVPAHIEPGDYVLGWRWDCEETAQVWTACADVTIASAVVV